MFNIGFSEMVIICIVLIIAVGPERLPSMMKTLGKTIRTLRQASRDIRASTGIDELLREDFDLYQPPRRPVRPVEPAQPITEPESAAALPVSRQDPIEPPAAAASDEAAPQPTAAAVIAGVAQPTAAEAGAALPQPEAGAPQPSAAESPTSAARAERSSSVTLSGIAPPAVTTDAKDAKPDAPQQGAEKQHEG